MTTNPTPEGLPSLLPCPFCQSMDCIGDGPFCREKRTRKADVSVGACACLGPQPGHTLCPCKERSQARAHTDALGAALAPIVNKIKHARGMGYQAAMAKLDEVLADLEALKTNGSK